MKSYLQYHRKYDRSLTLAVVGVLQDEKDRREKVLTELRNRVRDLSRKTDIEGNVSTLPVERVTEQLASAELEEKVAATELQLLQESADTSIEEFRQQITGELGETAAAEAKRRYVVTQQELKAKLRSLTARRQVLQSKLGDEMLKQERQRQPSGASQADLVDLEFARNELERQEEVHDRIGRRIVQLQTEEVAPSRVELVDSAKASESPVGAFPIHKILWSGLSGLILPFCLVIAWGLVRR